MSHKSCKYSYMGKKRVGKEVYESLLDRMIMIYEEIDIECCGLNPEVFEIKKGQPLCQYYEKRDE